MELCWPRMRTLSEAAMSTPTNNTGAKRPLMTAVQKRALTGLTWAKSRATPAAVAEIRIA